MAGRIRRGAAKVYRALTGTRSGQNGREQPAAPPTQIEDDFTEAKSEYAHQLQHFRGEVQRRNLGDVENFYWYHTVDLGGGLVTPGDYDFRGCIADYPFPKDMSGMSALDVGSATGFFAFELERRGAEVTSVDLPSIADWDLIWSDRELAFPGLRARYGTSNIQEVDRFRTPGPFDFCHRLRGSRVNRCLSRIYDLTPEKLGREQFDFMFLGDILGHLFSPLAALNVLAPLCSKQMVISLSLVDLPHSSLFYGGGEKRGDDNQSWFQPNWEAIRQMLLRVGFRKVERAGESRVLVRRAWRWISRDLIVATK